MNIRIEKVGDINFDYPYLEVFYKDSNDPFLDIGITPQRQLDFKFYSSSKDINLTVAELDRIIDSAKKFLPEALRDEDYFLNSTEFG